ncbi:MAG TPA: hypothetical protein VGV61_14020 [Thermoanaerobaculia bacterium]|nr:hypothetical protein [Thermoanaerobaculia bacterium]
MLGSPPLAQIAIRSLRARISAALPLLAGAAVLAVLLLPLARPGRMLMVRDLALFHLPLRVAETSLLRGGELPEWNPAVHGGEPILSNPNYAAFYPPTWLGLLLPVAYAMNLLVLAHAAWAYAGSWRLLRAFGAGREATALGALSFAGASWFLSLTSTFTIFCAMAWFPWVLAAGTRALAASPGRWLGAAFATAACLALQLFAGEPVTVFITALALACLALTPLPQLARAFTRLLAIGALAALLAAAQLVPTLHRLAGGERAGGLAATSADIWSSAPARLVDFVLPHAFGDAMADEEGHWFGWGVHDRDFPYVIALYSGLLPTVLALFALLAARIPHRAGWAAAALLGLLLALGRHGPLWEPLRRLVPVLGAARYPEKFALLAAGVIPLAGALGWQQLLGAEDAGRRRAWLPALAAAGVGMIAALAGLDLLARPAAAAAFVRAHSGMPPSPRALADALAYLRREALVALLLAVAVTLVLALFAAGRLPARAAALLALGILGADLWWYGHGLTPTLPTATALAPSPAVAAARAAGGRLFSAIALDRRSEVAVRMGPRGFQQLWGRAQRLDPYAGTLWGLEYALHPDYDLMLTRWGRHGFAQLQAAWPQREPVDQLLGAWDVGALVQRRAGRELLAELRRTGRPPLPYRVIGEPRRLPRFRFVTTVQRIEDAAAATAALPDLDLATNDLCIAGDAPPEAAYGPATLLTSADGQRPRLRYRAEATAYLVAAVTFDDGWEATLDGSARLPTCPTALGQVGVRLPPGEHELRLRYRDPWVRIGGATTLVTALAAALAAMRRRPLPVESAA